MPAAKDLSATNNVAEYCGLGFALRRLADQRWQGRLEIRGDSTLVIKQLTGEWGCHNAALGKLLGRCKELLADLGGDYEISWVPREQNERCDELSRQAYVAVTGNNPPERRKPAKAVR